MARTGGKPIYKFRCEGRQFGRGRCLIPSDSYYEFTTPAHLKAKRKDRWRFRPAGGEPFAIAGPIRANPEVSEAFTMITISPGTDVASYLGREIMVLAAGQWRGWLDGSDCDYLAKTPHRKARRQDCLEIGVFAQAL